MNKIITSLLTGVALLAAAGAAQATTISGGSATISNTLTDYNTNMTGNLTKFDTTLGTLNSVTFTYTYGFNSVITVVANTASTGDTRTESGAAFHSADSNIQAVLDSLVNTTSVAFGVTSLNPAAYDVLGTKRTYNQGAGTTQTYNSNSTTNTTTVTSNVNSQLLPFEASGGGAITLSGQTLTGLTGSATGGNATITQQTFATQGFSITYDYTAAPPPSVPEPASIALLGAGLLGLGLIRRKSA